MKFKVGDKIKFNYEGKTYHGYVAVIRPNLRVGVPYLLRLDGFDGHSGGNLDEDWFPEHEKKNEYNCWWAREDEIEFDDSEYQQLEKLYTHSWEKLYKLPFNFPYGKTLPNKINNKKTMSKIVKRIKDLGLSSEEKLLRKHGMHDEEGNLTMSGREAVMLLEAKERGFKSWEEMNDHFYQGSEGALSLLETSDLYKKHYDKLLEIVKEQEAEDKKSKK